MLLTMTETLISELRRWLRAAGVRRGGGRALTGARELFWLAQDAQMDSHDVRRARLHFQRLPLMIGDGDVWRRLANHLDPLARAGETHKFLRRAAQIAPTWLARSPWAASGKFELFYRLTRPGCGWPQQGDVLDGDRVVEIKGQHGQLTHPTVTGAVHHRESVIAFGGKGFIPNVSRSRAMEGGSSYEIIKPYLDSHYSSQFHQRSGDACAAIAQYLERLQLVQAGTGMAYAGAALGGPEGFGEHVRRAWLQAIYEKRVEDSCMDRLVVFGDGSSVKVIERAEDLRKLDITGVALRTGTPDRLSLRVG